jgi:signal transduction histidine kinase
MSFRLRLFVGVTLAVLLTASVYGLLGYLAFRRSLGADESKSADSFKQAVLASLEVSGSRPTLNLNDSARAVFEAYSTSRFHILKNGRVAFEFGGKFPQITRDWLMESVLLENGYRLELAFNIAENRTALNSYVRTALLALPAALGLAVLLAFILQRVFLRPVRDLTHATNLLSKQAMPEPVSVPPGNDELSQLAESFNRMTLSVQSFIERERSFTRYASHELRTPLSNMRVLIEGMQKGILPPQRVYPQLEETMKRMEGILSGLLTLTRSATVELEPVMLADTLRHVVSELPPEAKRRVKVMSEVSPIVLAREDLIKQVVSNLVSNALKYTDDVVEIKLEEQPNGVRVRVRDFGAGVSEASLVKLTEPFFRVDKRKAGLGLGLALVNHIVLSLKGDFEVRNAQPGLEATITLLRATEIPEGRKPKETVYA